MDPVRPVDRGVARQTSRQGARTGWASFGFPSHDRRIRLQAGVPVGGQGVAGECFVTAPTCQGAYLVQQLTWATGRRGHEVRASPVPSVVRASFLVELAHRNSSILWPR